MGVFTKSLFILLIAISLPLLYRQFATDKTVKFMSSYYSNYNNIDQFLRKSASQIEQAKDYLADSKQVKVIVDQVQQQIKQQLESFSSKKDDNKPQQPQEKPVEKKILPEARLSKCPGEANPVRVWSKQELANFDGKSGETDIYLAFLGTVYNVSVNAQHYANGAEYNVFAGRDATRAFVTGNFTHDLHDDITDIDVSFYPHVESWASFYSASYQVLGRIEGRFFDSKGCSTQELERVQHMFNKLEQDKVARREIEQEIPECNSEWNSDTQKGKVWCTAKSGGVERDWVGVPRMFNDGSTNRCACFNKDAHNAEDLGKSMSVYPGCNPDSTECSLLQ